MKVGANVSIPKVPIYLFIAWIVLRYVVCRNVWRHPRMSLALAFGIAGFAYFGSPWASLAALLPSAALYVMRLVRVRRNAFGVSGLPMTIRASSRVSRVARRWPKACAHAKLVDAVDHEAPTLAGIHADGESVVGCVDLGGSGMTIDALQKAVQSICSSMRCRVVSVKKGELSSEAVIVFRWEDPLVDVIDVDELAEFDQPDDKQTVLIGLTDEYDLATVDTRRSLLAVGETGSGKSGLVWALLAGFQRRGIPVRLRVVDPAGGTELAALRLAGEWVWTTRTEEAPDGSRVVQYHGVSRLVHGPARPTGLPPASIRDDKTVLRVCRSCLVGERPMFHVHSYTDNPRDAGKVIEDQRDAMKGRLANMSGKSRKHVPTLDEPHDLCIVDELLALQEMLKKGVDSALGEVAFMGRKAAFTVALMSQLAQKETLGQVRDLIPQRIALALGNRETIDATLGPGATAGGARCYDIPPTMQGTGYMYQDGVRGFQRFRIAWCDDDAIAVIASGELAVASAYASEPDDVDLAAADPFDEFGVPVDYDAKRS